MEKFLRLIICLSCLPLSCQKLGLCKDKEFSFDRLDNTTGKLRLDGYYYSQYFNDSTEELSIVCFLYENGIFEGNSSGPTEEVREGDVEIDDSFSRNSAKTGWGIYKIEGDEIEIQTWLPTQLSCHAIQVEKGVIENDSTFIITSTYTTKDKDEQEVNSIFRFVPYSPKPDSINSFFQ